jgi:hypothetical protein
MGLYISVSDALRVAKIKSLQDFKHVVTDVEVGEGLVESPEVHVTGIHVLHDKGGCLGHWVSNYIDEVDNVDGPLQSLEDLDLPPDLGLLDWLEDLYDDSFVVQRVNAFVDLRVFASANFFYDLVILLGPKDQKVLGKGLGGSYPNLTSKFS